MYITKKKIKGNTYYYLEESVRINGKRQRAWQKYLGPEHKFQDLKLKNLFDKDKDNIKTTIYEFGISAALFQIAKEINLVKVIDDNTNKIREQGLSVGEYITLAAINRCAAPCSKSKLSKWFEHDWISSQFNIKPEILNSQTYWNHFQYLSKEIIDNIELSLNQEVLKNFDLNLDCLFYDPTNFYTFSKDNNEDGLLQFGHSKENRNGNKLVNYTLLCARESGVPIMHHTYPGNINDVKKFKDMPKMIKKRLKQLKHNAKEVILVFDKGNHSIEAFKAIDNYGFGFIVSLRNSTQKELLHVSQEKFVKTILPATKKAIEYYKTVKTIYGHKRDVYVILDPKKQKKHTIKFNEKFDEKISNINEYFKNRINIKKWRKKSSVEEKIKSMIGKNPFKNIIEYAVSGTNTNLSFKININEKEKDKHIETLGKSIIFTNIAKLTPEEIIWGYREQYIVEHAFRKMKSPASIAIRPMYHHTDRCIRAHVFICVISLLLLSLLRLKLANQSNPVTYTEILEELGAVHVMKIDLSSKGDSLWKLDPTKGLASKLIKLLKLKDLLKE